MTSHFLDLQLYFLMFAGWPIFVASSFYQESSTEAEFRKATPKALVDSDDIHLKWTKVGKRVYCYLQLNPRRQGLGKPW